MKAETLTRERISMNSHDIQEENTIRRRKSTLTIQTFYHMMIISRQWLLAYAGILCVIFSLPHPVSAQTERPQRVPPQGARRVNGEYPLPFGGSGLRYFVKSDDRNAVCGPSVEVTVRGGSANYYDDKPTLRDIRGIAAGVVEIICNQRRDVEKIYFTMYDGEQQVRRIWVSRSDSFTVLHEEGTNRDALPNPSGETLDTSNLTFQTLCDYIFYGRFNRLRVDDPGRANFSWLYYEFIRQYGIVYREYLKPPIQTIEKTVTRNGLPIHSSRITMEERIVASFQNNEQYRTGIFGAERYARDIAKILERHQASNSPALRLFYENLYRYASDLPSVQESLKITEKPKPEATVLAGDWEMTTHRGTTKSLLKITREGDELNGVIINNRGETPLKSILLKGKQITFIIEIKVQGQILEMTYKGNVQNDRMEGYFDGLGTTGTWVAVRRK